MTAVSTIAFDPRSSPEDEALSIPIRNAEVAARALETEGSQR